MILKELLLIGAFSLLFGAATTNLIILDQENAPSIQSSNLIDYKGQGKVLGTSTKDHSTAWQQVFF